MELTKEDDPLQIYFDDLKDSEWPEGAFACGIPGGDTYYGATADEAYAKWRAAQSPASGLGEADVDTKHTADLQSIANDMWQVAEVYFDHARYTKDMVNFQRARFNELCATAGVSVN